MNSTISTPFLPQKTVAISLLADTICLNFFSLFGEVCAFTALIDSWFQHSQMKPRFHHLILIWCDWEIYCHLCGIILKKSKLKPFSAFYVHLWKFSEPVLLEICGNSHQSSEIVKCCLSQIFVQHSKQDHHSLQMANHFVLHHEHLFGHLWTFYTIVLQFLNSLHFVHELLCIIHDRFPQHSYL
jgi:hypothetical protein